MANNNPPNSGENLRRCAFCGRNEHQVNFLIPSPTGVYICDVCVDACSELIDQTLEEVDEHYARGKGKNISSCPRLNITPFWTRRSLWKEKGFRLRSFLQTRGAWSNRTQSKRQ